MDEFGGPRLGEVQPGARQLTAMILNLQGRLTIRQLIETQLRYSESPDEAVTRVLDFLRMWATYHFPRLLRGLNNIQRDVSWASGAACRKLRLVCRAG